MRGLTVTILGTMLLALIICGGFYVLAPDYGLDAADTAVVVVLCFALVSSMRWVVRWFTGRRSTDDDEHQRS